VHPFLVCGLAGVALVTLGDGPSAADSSLPDSLWHAEVRAGYGVSTGGSGSRMTTRTTPLTLQALVGFALEDDPPLDGYGGLTVQTLDRNAVGGVFGVTLAPRDSRWHLSGGGEWIVAPFGLVGATASGGMCSRRSALVELCGDLQLTAYFAGSDLAEGHTVTQLQLMFGVMFDAR
jgi:hypothetical protein